MAEPAAKQETGTEVTEVRLVTHSPGPGLWPSFMETAPGPGSVAIKLMDCRSALDEKLVRAQYTSAQSVHRTQR